MVCTPKNADDYYSILGVRPTASPEAIKRAYHRLARTYHPDVNNAPDAEERMKALNRAYEILSDPERRQQYDRDHFGEPVPVRREPQKTPARKPGDYTPGYRPASPAPARPTPHWVAWAAGFSVILLILLVMGAGTPQETAELPESTLTITPVMTATPLPTVPLQRTFDSWKTEGDRFVARHQNGDALAAYDQALKIQPAATELWIAEGDIYEQMGYFSNALSCYERAATISTNAAGQVQAKITVLKNMKALDEEADAFIEQENYTAAIAVYNTILAAGLKNADYTKRILSAKMYALMKSGRTSEAEAVRQAIAVV